MKIKHFTDLEVWKEAHKLTLLVYKITNKFPKSELYGLTSQLRRAVVSIESCIAEGFSRFHYRDRLNFYYDARGSVGEVESQILDAKGLRFILLAANPDGSVGRSRHRRQPNSPALCAKGRSGEDVIQAVDYRLIWKQAEKVAVILGGLIRSTEKLSQK